MVHTLDGRSTGFKWPGTCFHHLKFKFFSLGYLHSFVNNFCKYLLIVCIKYSKSVDKKLYIVGTYNSLNENPLLLKNAQGGAWGILLLLIYFNLTLHVGLWNSIYSSKLTVKTLEFKQVVTSFPKKIYNLPRTTS